MIGRIEVNKKTGEVTFRMEDGSPATFAQDTEVAKAVMKMLQQDGVPIDQVGEPERHRETEAEMMQSIEQGLGGSSH